MNEHQQNEELYKWVNYLGQTHPIYTVHIKSIR